MSALVCCIGSETTVVVDGELDMVSADELRTTLDQCLQQQGIERLVVDLSGVSFCDCSGLNVLLLARRRAGEAGVDFKLAGPALMVRRLFTLTGTAALFGLDYCNQDEWLSVVP